MRGLFGKALILAAAASLASMTWAAAGTATSTPCGSQLTCVPVSWEPLLTQPLTGPYLAPPTTTTTRAGVPFAMQNAFIFLGPGTSTVAGGLSVVNPTAVHLLINAANTPLTGAGAPAGSLTLTFADATTSTTALVLGTNLREWKIGAGGTVNTVTSPTNVPWWIGRATDQVAAAIDMLTISVPTGSPDLVSVTVTNSATQTSLLVTGLTVEDPPAPPAPPAPIVTPPADGHSEVGEHHDKGKEHKEHGSKDAKPKSDAPEHEDDEDD